MPVTIPDRPFVDFGKISRANKAFNCVITEKLDGTNSQIVIEDGKIVGVGSRNRWIAPGKANDNFGFAGWVTHITFNRGIQPCSRSTATTL